jgi:hypothetical protein
MTTVWEGKFTPQASVDVQHSTEMRPLVNSSSVKDRSSRAFGVVSISLVVEGDNGLYKKWTFSLNSV